jgi:hypothetical protein
LEYTVQAGDCILSLATRYGFFWQTLWKANRALKALRNNPNVLMPGDTVIIPDKTIKELPCATDQLHKFVKKGARAKFRLIVERFNIALAQRHYILKIGSDVFDGTTDDTGLIEVSIDPTAIEGHLQMPDDDLECDLQLGYLDPLEETTGVQHRLQNLGFYFGELDGADSDDLHAAIADFQSSVGLDPTGELDDNTRQNLLLMQDQVHPQCQPEAPDPEDQGDSSGPLPALEPAIDPAADAAELARFTSLDD